MDNGTNPLVDEADENPEANLIAGTWLLKSAVIDNGTATTEVNNSTYSLEYTATSTNENTEVSFSEAPDRVISSGDYTMVINFTFLGVDYSENITSNTPFSSGDWSITDNTLKLAANETVNGDYEIVELTETTLILNAEVNRVIETGGVSLDTRGTLVITLGKAQ